MVISIWGNNRVDPRSENPCYAYECGAIPHPPPLDPPLS